MIEKQKNIVEAFIDGACRGNPGPGGWGVLLRYKGKEKRLKGGEFNTTNNRMELTAAINALLALKQSSTIVIVTDSKYVHDGVLKWLENWKKKDWKNSHKKLVKNKELWEKLDELIQLHDVTWQWVRGHSGHAENEEADRLANEALDNL